MEENANMEWNGAVPHRDRDVTGQGGPADSRYHDGTVVLDILFDFKHPYYKLYRERFTTIRSIRYAKQHKIMLGRIGWVSLQGKPLKLVKVIGMKDMRIIDMPLSLLKEDAEYPGFRIESHLDFVELLNSFSQYPVNKVSTKKRIFYLEVIDPWHVPNKLLKDIVMIQNASVVVV